MTEGQLPADVAVAVPPEQEPVFAPVEMLGARHTAADGSEGGFGGGVDGESDGGRGGR